MRKLLLCSLALLPLSASAQLGTFERLTLPKPDTFYVNYSQPGKDVGVTEAFVHYPCVYDTAFGGLWSSGFAWSNMTDTTTPGYGNQYSAKYKKGVDTASKQYMVVNGGHNYVKAQKAGAITSFYVTNTVYAYYSMLNGDAFAKKFGGASGNDSDWFKLTIKGYDTKGVYPMDSFDFYLADFRFSDNSKDYILNDWTPVNLPFNPAHELDSLTFSLSSSDTGMFGINTPLYFALDNVFFLQPSTVAALPFDQQARIFPVPAQSLLHLELNAADFRSCQILDMSGRVVAQFPISNLRQTLDISSFPAGRYVLRLRGKAGKTASTFIKQ
ncbi:MAG: DUF4465 domain-containing protein [Bacteroidetes bacterium]|nr:DUF4465 domain-containing protein [Bacteroidota bacterium]